MRYTRLSASCRQSSRLAACFTKKKRERSETPLTLSRWGQEKTYLVAGIAIGIPVLKGHAIVLLIERTIATT
jgi:hypothetical protein